MPCSESNTTAVAERCGAHEAATAAVPAADKAMPADMHAQDEVAANADAGSNEAAALLAQLPAAGSSNAECKAFMDALPPGVYIATSMDMLRVVLAAAQAADAVAVTVLPQQPAFGVDHGIDPDKQMPPAPGTRESEQWLRQRTRGSSGRAAAVGPRLRHMTQLRAIALAWAPDRAACFAIEVPRRDRRGSKGCPKALQFWPDVAKMLTAPNTKVLRDAHAVVNHLRALDCDDNTRSVLSEWLPAGGFPLHLGGTLADVQVSASMLGPGSFQTVIESAELLLRKTGSLPGWQAAHPDGAAPQSPPPEAMRLAPGQDARVTPEHAARELLIAREALHAIALHQQLQPALSALQLLPALERVEWPLTRVLADLEWQGMPVDPAVIDEEAQILKAFKDELAGSFKRVAREHGLADAADPEPSCKHVPLLLWDKLKLQPPPNAQV